MTSHSCNNARTLGIRCRAKLAGVSLPEGQVLAITGLERQDHDDDAGGRDSGQSGKETLVGGNIGTPVISLAGQSPPDTIGVWSFGFRWESIETVLPWIAAILILRQTTWTAITRSRLKSTRRPGSWKQQQRDFAVLNADAYLRRAERQSERQRCCGFRRSSAWKRAFLQAPDYFSPERGRSSRTEPLRFQFEGANTSENVSPQSPCHGCRLRAAAGSAGSEGVSRRRAPSELYRPSTALLSTRFQSQTLTPR